MGEQRDDEFVTIVEHRGGGNAGAGDGPRPAPAPRDLLLPAVAISAAGFSAIHAAGKTPYKPSHESVMSAGMPLVAGGRHRSTGFAARLNQPSQTSPSSPVSCLRRKSSVRRTQPASSRSVRRSRPSARWPTTTPSLADGLSRTSTAPLVRYRRRNRGRSKCRRSS